MNSELEQYLPLVRAVAKRYTSEENELEELITAGTIGLMEAEEKFDKDSGVRFISFAVWFIRRSIESCVKCRQDGNNGSTFHEKRDLD